MDDLTRATAARLVALAAGVALAGCFEAGPLGVGGPDPGDPVDAAVTFDVSDPGQPDTQAPDVGKEPDPGAADVAPEVPRGTPCLTELDCQGVEANPCLGPVVCLDYVCRQDTSAPVTCEAPADPCLEAVCDPMTGGCVTEPVCVCKPLPTTLKCGQLVKLSTADAGATASMTGYTCGPEPKSTGEHTWLFEAKQTGPVKVTATASKLGGIYVLGWDGTNCQRDQCLGGGERAVAFTAQAGENYAIVVEHPVGAPVALQVLLQCNIGAELDCGDGLDDDGDGLTDCEDVDDCGLLPQCGDPVETSCANGIDDDEDGLTDCADDDCAVSPDCLQACTPVSSPVATCGWGQGLTTGGGKSEATDYSCGPAAPGKEIIYKFQDPSITVTTQVTVASGIETQGMGLYVMQDQGAGCTPQHCIGYGVQAVTFPYTPGQTYYLAIDALANVTGSFNLEVTCGR